MAALVSSFLVQMTAVRCMNSVDRAARLRDWIQGGPSILSEERMATTLDNLQEATAGGWDTGETS